MQSDKAVKNWNCVSHKLQVTILSAVRYLERVATDRWQVFTMLQWFKFHPGGKQWIPICERSAPQKCYTFLMIESHNWISLRFRAFLKLENSTIVVYLHYQMCFKGIFKMISARRTKTIPVWGHAITDESSEKHHTTYNKPSILKISCLSSLVFAKLQYLCFMWSGQRSLLQNRTSNNAALKKTALVWACCF